MQFYEKIALRTLSKTILLNCLLEDLVSPARTFRSLSRLTAFAHDRPIRRRYFVERTRYKLNVARHIEVASRKKPVVTIIARQIATLSSRVHGLRDVHSIVKVARFAYVVRKLRVTLCFLEEKNRRNRGSFRDLEYRDRTHVSKTA